jgi:type II secretory pathway pseudopilin PulG
MKTPRVLLFIIGVAVLAFAPMLMVDSYKARKARQEHERMTALRLVVVEKVEAYEKANGRYPDSLAVLSFTNSPREIEMATDLPKIRYRLTPSGYGVGWDGKYGYAR